MVIARLYMCFILFLIRNFLEKCTIHDSYSKIQTREIFKGICQYAMYGYPQNRLFGLDGVVCHHKIYFPPLVYLLCHLCIRAILVLLSSISPLISCFLVFCFFWFQFSGWLLYPANMRCLLSSVSVILPVTGTAPFKADSNCKGSFCFLLTDSLLSVNVILYSSLVKIQVYC